MGLHCDCENFVYGLFAALLFVHLLFSCSSCACLAASWVTSPARTSSASLTWPGGHSGSGTAASAAAAASAHSAWRAFKYLEQADD